MYTCIHRLSHSNWYLWIVFLLQARNKNLCSTFVVEHLFFSTPGSFVKQQIILDEKTNWGKNVRFFLSDKIQFLTVAPYHTNCHTKC